MGFKPARKQLALTVPFGRILMLKKRCSLADALNAEIKNEASRTQFSRIIISPVKPKFWITRYISDNSIVLISSYRNPHVLLEFHGC